MPLLLFAVFIVVSLVELTVLIQVGQVIGPLWTVLLLIVVSAVGAWLVKREGIKAWRRFRAAIEEARLPTREVVDGGLVLFGGALLLTPGFITDIVGLVFIAPPTRALLSRVIRTRIRWRVGLPGMAPPPPGMPPRDDAVNVDVIEVKRNERRP